MFPTQKIVLFFVLLVSMNKLFACTLSASSGVNFGTYNPFNSVATQSLTQVEVTCTEADSGAFTLTLDTGSSGTFTNRTFISGDYTMNYNLYLNAAYATIWGDGSSGTGLVSDEASNCLNGCQYTIYGLIPSNQISVGVGMYSDIVNATLTF